MLVQPRSSIQAGLCLSRFHRPSITLPRFLVPALVQGRWASQVNSKNKSKIRQRATFDLHNNKAKEATRFKKSPPKDFKRHDLVKAGFPTFSLYEAMRTLRAAEVGQPPTSVKYELHIMLKTPRSGPVIKSNIRLPAPAQNDWRIAVICPEGSKEAIEATAEGAVAVGEETLFEAIRKEEINFDRLLCLDSSEAKLKKANLGKILGPKGLMPNHKMGTIVKNVAKAIRDSAGAIEYRERDGVIHTTIGQLTNTAAQLKANMQALMSKVKQQCAMISEGMTQKEVHEVVLSSTNGPALTLSGKVKHEGDTVNEQDVSGTM
ncbi:hypothetical protein XA68_18056 [Ophiocordyceps unilateralis]|uniref:Ribosomal protein n=1 Tax=Ophiocordyceps unilateralis TaxID=268505 RepID=A0A2A9PJX1_OPHUN|nr:hypothetical protein XA68_18056 [Ophiocordyceps unilateralis]